MTDSDTLKKLADRLVDSPNLWPIYDKDGKLLETFCNFSARLAAQAMLCDEFNDPDLLADDMVSIIRLNASGKWHITTGQEAANQSIAGKLAYACQDSKTMMESHGHITLISPEAMRYSGSFEKDVPVVANIGKGDPSKALQQIENHPLGYQTKPNWYCKTSEAFPVSKGEPLYAWWG